MLGEVSDHIGDSRWEATHRAGSHFYSNHCICHQILQELPQGAEHPQQVLPSLLQQSRITLALDFDHSQNAALCGCPTRTTVSELPLCPTNVTKLKRHSKAKRIDCEPLQEQHNEH